MPTDPATIPLIEAGKAGPIVLIEEEPDRLQDILACARDHYGDLLLKLGDRVARRWLEKSGNPYLPEIATVSDLAAPVGAYVLNTSYEWACTTGLAPDPEGGGNRLLRSLDWPLCGLGRNVVVAMLEAEAGPYYSVTWPGYAGVLTAMAPGRFSAALNQPPMARATFLFPLDWGLVRLRMLMRPELPPAHLLRQAFEVCATYEEARELLISTPVALPVFYSLSGVEPEQCCIVLRTADEATVLDGPGSIANHWPEAPRAGYDRGWDSPGRLAAMEAARTLPHPDPFDWVAPPILNPTTRLAVAANAATGTLLVRGYEKDGIATRNFRLCI